MKETRPCKWPGFFSFAWEPETDAPTSGLSEMFRTILEKEAIMSNQNTPSKDASKTAPQKKDEQSRTNPASGKMPSSEKASDKR